MNQLAVPSSSPAPRDRLRRLLGRAGLALWAVTTLLWLLDVTGHGLPKAVSRAAVLAAAAAGLAWIAAVLMDAWQVPGQRRTTLLLPALLALSLAVRLLGIGHEAEGRYYEDEGTYYHHASEINQGDVLRFSFVYPHLTYYADAFVLWLASLFPVAVAKLAAGLYGIREPLGVSWLLLRGVVALLSALTVVPIFQIARRLGGTFGSLAGALASLLLIFSPLYNEGSHLNTCDVPSAFFATLCLLFVARLIDEETTRDYLLAGLAAGLAAASKYPAGVVAVAIVAVWLFWRVSRRNWSWGLLSAGVVSLAAFVAAMPSLLFFPSQALLGDRGIFFGARQYSQGGWLGVMPSSNGLFYLDNLAWSFGLLVLLAGLAGLFLLDPSRRRRLLWLAPYPVLFLLLIASMNMVVRRNLYPVVPILAVYLALGLAAAIAWLHNRLGEGSGFWAGVPPPLGGGVVGSGGGEGGGQFLDGRVENRSAPWRSPEENPPPDLPHSLPPTLPGGEAPPPGPAHGPRGWLAPAALSLLLFLPLLRTFQQEIGLARPSTREVAAAWIRANVPLGVTLVKESYTPDFFWYEYQVEQRRFAGRFSVAELRDPGNDYILLASAAYGRFEQPDQFLKEHHREYAQRYRQVFSTFPLVQRWPQTSLRLGPELRLYRIPDPPVCGGPAADLPAASAFVPDGSMRPRPKRPIQYTVDGQWAAFKGCFDAGTYRVTLRGEPAGPGELEVAALDGKRLGKGSLDAAAGREVRLPRRGKYLLYVYLPVGSRVRSLIITASSPPSRRSAP